MNFWKVQSVGNHFALVEDAARSDFPALTRWACDPRFGIGGDGLLVVSPKNGGLDLRMFNPDGTEDFCGNGIRCAVWHGLWRGWVEGGFVVRHLGRDVPVSVEGGANGRTSPLISTNLGRATFEPADVPLASGLSPMTGEGFVVEGRTFEAWALSTGTTHTVVFVDELPRSPDFERIGVAFEHHPAFPERTSVMFAKPEGNDTLRLRIWERGVGETFGCGSGTCATASAFVRRQGLDGPQRVVVENPGGTLVVHLDAWDAPITVTGRAERVFEGSLTWPR